jgi:hypothetical protein
MNWKMVLGFSLGFSLVASVIVAEEYQLQYFLEKSSMKTYDLSKKERTELLNRVERVLEQTKEIQLRLSRTIQAGETDVKYQEGRFWMARLEEDQGSIDSGARQLNILREKPTQLVAAIKLYKSLKDLAFHFNTYSNMSSFSASIGDVAPELELWTDPIFYRLYVLPLARSVETKTPKKDKKPETRDKKPDPKAKKP